MAAFSYRAVDARGRYTKGVINAESLRAARQILRQQGIFPTTLTETRARETGRPAQTAGAAVLVRSRKVNPNQLSIATRQLATLAGAGMPLVEALKALGEQIDDPGLRGVISEVGEQVNEGSTLANALRQYPGVFPRLYVNMVASGEASGSLELVLNRLAELLETQTALRRKVRSALTYPALMLTLCFGVVILLLTYVVPQITAIFAERKAVLPLPTRIIIAASDLVRESWFLVIPVIVLMIFAYVRYARTPAGRKRIDRITLRLPLIGGLTLKVATSRLARNLGTMLSSGVELLSTLAIAKNIIGNVILEGAVEQAIDGVREGSSLAAELKRSRSFPRMLVHMVAIGERTGQLEQMLHRAADAYESEVNAVISSLTSILEPILILFLAVVVGCILAAVMLPMLEMSALTAG